MFLCLGLFYPAVWIQSLSRRLIYSGVLIPNSPQNFNEDIAIIYWTKVHESNQADPAYDYFLSIFNFLTFVKTIGKSRRNQSWINQSLIRVFSKTGFSGLLYAIQQRLTSVIIATIHKTKKDRYARKSWPWKPLVQDSKYTGQTNTMRPFLMTSLMESISFQILLTLPILLTVSLLTLVPHWLAKYHVHVPTLTF